MSASVRSSPFGCGPSTDERGSVPTSCESSSAAVVGQLDVNRVQGAQPPRLPGWLGAQGRCGPSPLRDEEVAEVVAVDPPVGRTRPAHPGGEAARSPPQARDAHLGRHSGTEAPPPGHPSRSPHTTAPAPGVSAIPAAHADMQEHPRLARGTAKASDEPGAVQDRFVVCLVMPLGLIVLPGRPPLEFGGRDAG